jgi:alkaline phosphatase D
MLLLFLHVLPRLAHQNLPGEGEIISTFAFASSIEQADIGPGQTLIDHRAWDTLRYAGTPATQVWEHGTRTGADLYILAGDIVNARCDPLNTASCPALRQAYHVLRNQTPFQRFDASAPYIATWNDNDYGVHRGDATNMWKAEVQALFNDNMRVPADDPRRSRQGLYRSYEWGPEGQRLQVILLDVRYFQTETTILGEVQWSWLEHTLKRPADLRLLVSGFQIYGSRFENWSRRWPGELKRLEELLKTTGADKVVVVSGDRHIGAFYQAGASDAGYTVNGVAPLAEVTASSLTHSWCAHLDSGPTPKILEL